MRSLLDALQEGRLVELPDVNKDEALEYLALLLEAVPDIGTKTDLVKAVMDREAQFNTGIGKGVAVPHCRTNNDGELLCAIGWAPKGVEYQAIDGKPVHLIFMYYVPDAQRNLYLKEISGLAKVLGGTDVLDNFSHIDNLTDLRDWLLDWVSQVISDAVPDAKARMIKLEARQASIEVTQTEETVSAMAGKTGMVHFTPFQYLCYDDKVLILSSDEMIADILEKDKSFKSNCQSGQDFAAHGYNISVLSETRFSKSRKIFNAVACIIK